jgi:hypothetical protein
MKAQSAESIGFRALCVMMACVRASVEADTLDAPAEKESNRKAFAKYQRWAEQVGIADHYSKYERDVIHRPIGRIPNDELHELGLWLQALGALLWAGGRMEMPPYHETIPADLVYPFLPERDDPVKPFLRSMKVRPENDLELGQLRAEFWNWRSRCEQMRRDGMPPPPGQTYDKTIARAAESAKRKGLIDVVVRGDVSCGGIPFGELDDRAFAFAAESAEQRHHALNWICGEADDWDKVTTDT